MRLLIILVGWALLLTSGLLVIRDFRHSRWERAALLVVLALHVPPMVAWTLGITAEAYWEGYSLLSRPIAVDPVLERNYMSMYSSVGGVAIIAIALWPYPPRLLRRPIAARTYITLASRQAVVGVVALTFLLITFGVCLSDAEVYHNSSDLVSPDGTRQVKVVLIRRGSFVSWVGKENLVFLFRRRGRLWWEPIGKFESPQLDSAEHVWAACTWRDGREKPDFHAWTYTGEPFWHE
ncbi:MAG: hypothetical protein ACYTF6_06825 [Planctomycetota bacterium]|jgi:hypothetical protein